VGRQVNLFSVLDQAATRFGEHGAVYRGTEQLHTFAELRDRALRLATSVTADRDTGARIAIASENRPEIIELMFAVWAAGCAVVPINFKLHPLEMAQILDDSGAAVVFASPKIAAGLAGVTDVPVEDIDSPAYAGRLQSEPAVPAHSDSGALAWLFYTSGTTGKSKGAMLSHRNLVAMTVSHLADFDSPDEHSSLVHGAPMSHGSGLYIAPYILRGARQVIPASAGFDPDEFLDLCDHHPRASCFLAPTMVQRPGSPGRR
jgi:acyl-CoA synthetase (AMP-forming)/AMP-acid ligase II